MPDSTWRLDDLLKDKLLYVPDYQRAYAWGKDQLRDFWEDLELIERGRTHYTGTVVVKRHGEGGYDEAQHSPLEVFDVVDGQQRLTTCLMLLDRLLDARDHLNDPRAAGDRERLLTVKINGIVRPRLVLSDENDEYWRKVIIDGDVPVQPPTLKSQSRLSFAATCFEEWIGSALASEASEDARLFWLQDMTGRVSKSLEFTVYQVKDDAEVGVIFETLNQRGKPLSELEKTKNYLLYLASRLPDGMRQELSSTVNGKFSEIFRWLGHAELSSSHEDALLRAHWLATQDPDARNWAGADSIKRRFHRRLYLDKPDLAYHEVSHYAESLAKGAFVYSEIWVAKSDAFAQFGSRAAEARIAADRLRRSGNVAIFVPLLLAARMAMPQAGDEYINITDICERYSVRVFMIGERRSHAGRSRLYGIAYEITSAAEAGNTPNELAVQCSAIVTEIAALIRIYADDDEVRNALIDTQRNWYAKPGHKFFLFQYELYLLGNKTPTFKFEDFLGAKRSQTTEHILPQNPGPTGWGQFTAERRARMTHSLGNLVLTFDNSAYSNHSFTRKRDGDAAHPGGASYASSTLLQERQLAELPEWNAAQLIARQERLADWAMTRWALPPVPVTVVAVTQAEALADATDVEESAVDQLG